MIDITTHIYFINDRVMTGHEIKWWKEASSFQADNAFMLLWTRVHVDVQCVWVIPLIKTHKSDVMWVAWVPWRLK